MAFYCEHIALQSVKENDRIMIYGPAIMNAETIISKENLEKAKTVGVGQNRKNEIDRVRETYPFLTDFREISQRALLYSLEDGDIDAAILDITKTAKVPNLPHRPLCRTDYVSYVLVVDREFAKTDAFADFVDSCNRAADRLNDRAYLAASLEVDEKWLDEQNIRFMKLKEPG